MKIRTTGLQIVCDNCGNRFNPTKPIKDYIGEKCVICGSVMVTANDVAKSELLDLVIKSMSGGSVSDMDFDEAESFVLRVNTKDIK